MEKSETKQFAASVVAKYLFSKSSEDKIQILNSIFDSFSILMTDVVLSGFEDDVLELFELSQVVDLKNQNGKTVLHLACELLKKKLVDKILEKEIDVNVKDGNGNTPLYVLVNSKLTKRIYETPDEDIRLKKEAIALSLLSKGADINIRNNTGETPLHCAAREGNNDMARFLLNHGAEPDIKSIHGDVALRIALDSLNKDSQEILRLLLEHGSNVQELDTLGLAAISYIISTNYAHYRTILIDLLIWGGSMFTLNVKGQRPVDRLISGPTPHVLQTALVEYIIALKCADLDWSEYTVVEEAIPTAFESAKNFVDLAKDQIEQMKKVTCGSYRLYDVFSKYRDPLFVLDKDVECAVQNAMFQINYVDYGELLKATFVRAQRRYKMMVEAHNKLTKELPNEVIWKILTFLEDKDLESVTKAVSG